MWEIFSSGLLWRQRHREGYEKEDRSKQILLFHCVFIVKLQSSNNELKVGLGNKTILMGDCYKIYVANNDKLETL